MPVGIDISPEAPAALMRALSGRLRDQVPELTDKLVADVLANDPSHVGFVPKDEFWQSVHDSLAAAIDQMTGRPRKERPDLSLAERIGRRRAEQGLPLESLLRCYRLGGRIFWEAMIDVVTEDDPDALPILLRYASTVWHTTEQQSTVVAEAYRRTESELLRRSTERVQALLDALLEGRGADGGLAGAAAAALDLPERGRYAVLVLRGSHRDPALVRPQELGGLRFAWRLRAESEVAVISLGEMDLDDAVRIVTPLLRGSAGISPEVEGLAALGRARWFAEVALGTCPPGEAQVVRLDRRLPAALVVAQPDLAHHLGEEVLGPLDDLDAVDREILLETLATWLDSEGSATRTAGRLYCHRNTVFNRLRRLEQLTSRSLHRPRDVVELSLALDAIRLVDGKV
ncbi:PucR family transcriptional regulator [Actinomadura craniellae]|uniref:PucR family transcriptional regulator n=1 Tax=Actinomadura craniellae TaxID=2231787 RepID=A0A365GZ47_9ACTN|nr:helix-turn-helix domain-containing protein [Actinomadura craniellae]RAY12115.1 PucR family transcriptional regulator [Actinomadura craniellae]